MKKLISLLFIFIAIQSWGVQVTFQVNMLGTIINSNGVSIAGSFQGWLPGNSIMTDSNADGIYEFTADIAANTNIEFKFINGNSWANEEIVPSLCGISNGLGGYNRIVSISLQDTVLSPVCFSSCENCIQPEPTVVAVFQVDMSNETISPNGVHIAGDFQGWNPNSIAMNDMGGGLFEIQVTLPQNTLITYKFINGNDWNSDENPPLPCGTDDGNGNTNRTFQTGNTNVLIGPVCFNQCGPCGDPMPVLVTFRTDLSNETVSSNGVYITGSFNNWDTLATPMSEYAPNKFEAVVVMNSNQTVQYKIINGFGWSNQENVPMECGTPNGFGGYDRTYTSTTNPMTTLEGDCFSGCGPCVIIPQGTVTFQVDLGGSLTGITPAPEGVHIAGNFNNWNPAGTPMTQIFGNVYSATITVPENTVVNYKFLYGNSWGTEETVPFECGIDDGSGNINRTYVVGTGITTLPIVCWEQCQPCPLNTTDIQLQNFVYPNPASEFVAIPRQLISSEFSVYNALGKLIYSGKSEVNQTLAVSSWPNGIYFILSQKESFKFIIEHEN